MTGNKIRTLVECALLIAMATVLSYIPIFQLPMGGSVTLCGMAPIIIASYRHGLRWGLFTGFVHSILQMILGLDNFQYCTTLAAIACCLFLDYIIAFTALGAACLFTRPFRNKMAGWGVGAAVVGLIRYLCSFLSGILIWGGYAPEGTPVWIYSLTYNGSYMIPEILLTTFAVVLVMRVIQRRPKQTGEGA